MRHSAGTWSGKTSEVPTFPKALQREIASHYSVKKRDAFSQ